MQNDFRLKAMILDLIGNLAFKGSDVVPSNPPIDLFFLNGNIVIKAELPGVDGKNISVKNYGNDIIINYTKSIISDKKRTYYKMERNYGKFEEKIRLPIYIGDAKIKAVLSDGILTITIGNDNKEK